MRRRLIINADDFGLTAGINRGIVRAHTEGILTSTTLLAGAPASEEALQLAKDHPALAVGVHLNLIEGPPVSNDPAIAILLDAQGSFVASPARLAAKTLLSRRTARAIQIELAAQIQWLVDRGITPSHLDSHKHTHAFPAIWPIVTRLARMFDIPAVRWPYEPPAMATLKSPPPAPSGPRKAFIVRNMARICRIIDPALIKNDLLFGIAHTGKIDAEFWDCIANTKQPFRTAEVMTHPGYADGLDPEKTRLVEQRLVELEALCSEDTKRTSHDAGIETTNYGKL